MNHPLVLVLARVLLASVFIVLGGNRLLGAASIGPLAGTAISNSALILSALELIVGLLIAVGWRVRVLSLIMAAALIADAILSHPFWNYSGGAQHAQLLNFFKNMAIVGGLILLSTTARRAR